MASSTVFNEGFLQNVCGLTGYLLLLLITIVVIIVYTRQNQVNLPPGPPRLPLIGSIPWINRSKPMKSFNKWANQYGPIVMFYIGSKRNVLINDAKLARDLLIKHGDVVSDRAKMPGARAKFGVKGGVILENGEDWKTHRRWLVTGLRHFGMGKRSIEKQIATEATQLCNEIQRESGKFYPFKYIINAVSNIICSISFGKRFEYDDPQFQEILDSVNAYFKYSHFGRIEDALPFLMKLYGKRYNHVSIITNFLKKQLREHKEKFDRNNIRDLIDVLLLQVNEDAEAEESSLNANDVNNTPTGNKAKKVVLGTGKSMYIAGKTVSEDRDSLWRSILSLFFAGTDTSTNTIMWYLLYMICYPAVQKRVQDEIRNVISGERSLTIQDKLKVPYFEATIYEVLRLSNIAPLLIPHCTSADFVVNGFNIPANTNFHVNLTFIHYDPKYWDDPLEFKPERFLDEAQTSLKKPDAFMPFGVGRRACLGESLAKMEIFIFLGSLLQSFTFELPESSKSPSFEPVIGVTSSPQYFEVIAKPR